VIEALRSGVADVVPKTADYLDYLPAAIERVLAQKRMQREHADAELLRARELHYRTLAEAIPQLVWTALDDGQVDFVSKQMLDYTGLTTQDLLGLAWADSLVHPDDSDRTLAAWLAAQGRDTDYAVEHRLRAADGSYRWFKTRAAPFVCPDGKMQKWFGTSTDIDEQTCVAQEREFLLASERKARAEAEAASRLKDEFVATLSHELRTPLNAIVGWAQLLLRDSGDAARVRKGLEVIDRNARLQAQMIDDLLDLSRIMSGKLRLDVQRVDVAELVDAVISTVQPAADAKEIRITSTLATSGSVRGDPARLQQVIWNLLTNAIKFTGKRGRVAVTLKRADSEVELMVSDTGQGISAEFLPYVFERFRQEDASTTRQYGGLGLGLSIVKQLVEMHGGGIAVTSDGEGHGASFTVCLPVAAADSIPGAGACDFGARACEDDAPELAGLHVLVVEDEPDARDLVQRVLEERGARITTAASAREALQAYERCRPDVIVSDIGMPGQDGYEFIRKLRVIEAPRGRITPAAALSALARSEDRRRALLAGYQTHLAKPVDPLELQVVVAALAGRTRALG
jgi:PAS domain S-box-containing protein